MAPSSSLCLVFALSLLTPFSQGVYRVSSLFLAALRFGRAKFSASGVTSGGPSIPLYIAIVSLLPLPFYSRPALPLANGVASSLQPSGREPPVIPPKVPLENRPACSENPARNVIRTLPNFH